MADKKNLKYFMRSTETEIITAPGPESIVDEDGNVVQFEIKVLSQEQINTINDNYRRHTMATDRKGNPLISGNEIVWKTERDNARATRHLIVEALQYPNLKDTELMKYYECVDVTEMPLKVFPRPDEYNYVLKIVLSALGLVSGEAEQDDLESAKN